MNSLIQGDVYLKQEAILYKIATGAYGAITAEKAAELTGLPAYVCRFIIEGINQREG